MANGKQRLKLVGVLQRADARRGLRAGAAFNDVDRRPRIGTPAGLWRGFHFEMKRVS